jgi:deazaflavin-dependent oxidoreductase (nitroreductase family)
LRSLGGVGLRDGLFRVVTGLHRAVFRASGGHLLGRAGGMPVVVLTTTGHRSGRKRRTMLTAPLVDGDRVVLVASYGGHSHNPHWFQNLLLRPEVGLTLGGRRERPMRARVASGDERAELWPRIVGAHPRYDGYQRKTDRRIPLVVLEPYAGPR